MEKYNTYLFHLESHPNKILLYVILSIYDNTCDDSDTTPNAAAVLSFFTA